MKSCITALENLVKIARQSQQQAAILEDLETLQAVIIKQNKLLTAYEENTKKLLKYASKK